MGNNFFRENYKIFLISLPVLILIGGYLIRFLILNIPYSQGIDFVDFYIYKETFTYYPERIYDYPLYIYLPQFLIEFFWINLYPLDIGKVMWSLLKLGLITLIWSVVVLEDFFNKIESLMFIILVLTLGFLNDFILGNSDTILLFCGFFGYYLLEKAEQSDSTEMELANQGLKKKIFNKSSIFTLISGILTGFALYKPLFFPFALLLLLKS
ncbi:MAG: DUF2029 domain-containing protein, partial [Candidatus Lokiarchaeota archaeon]|nr:DUF2029 domain-containing protein [Candidatus Lokiarchaeota archaeon]